MHFLKYPHPVEFSGSESGSQAHIQTVLVLAFPIPATLSCPPFLILSALPLLVFGLCVQCWFWSSLVHHVQPQGTAQFISGSYSYCSWSTANFLEHASLPEMWFCFHSVFHLKFFQGDPGTPVVSVHLLQLSFAILPCLSLMLLITATPLDSQYDGRSWKTARAPF